MQGVKNVKELGMQIPRRERSGTFWEGYSRKERAQIREFSESLLQLATLKVGEIDLVGHKSLPHLIVLAGGYDENSVQTLDYAQAKGMAYNILSKALLYALLVNDSGNSSDYYLKNYLHKGVSVDPIRYEPVGSKFSEILIDMGDLNSRLPTHTSDMEESPSLIVREFLKNFGADSFFRSPYSLEIYPASVRIQMDPLNFTPQHCSEDGITYFHNEVARYFDGLFD